MVSVVIFGGGTGTRMKSSDIPKQFIKVDGKPIIIRTLEHFSNNKNVDNIVISCLDGWIDELWHLIHEYNIKKVKAIVKGGITGHESIKNGLNEVYKLSKCDEDIVLICDAVRPLISVNLIDNCISNTQKYGTAVPVTPSIDSVLWSDKGDICNKSMPRQKMYITQAPQGYKLKSILSAHMEAKEKGIIDATSSSELFIALGKEVKLFIGERENIKVTTQEDLHTLRSYYFYNRYMKFIEEELKYGL